MEKTNRQRRLYQAVIKTILEANKKSMENIDEGKQQKTKIDIDIKKSSK